MNSHYNIYNLLLEQDYDGLTTIISNCGTNIFVKILLKNEYFIDFEQKVKKTLNINLGSSDNIYTDNDNNHIAIYLKTNIPINRFHDKSYKITIEDYVFLNQSILDNLPSGLKVFEISHYNKISINNLPSQLTNLILYCPILNLDYLPESLKILILYLHNNYNYTLDNLCNLPKSLEKIIIEDKEYNSVEDIINNFV